MPLVINPNNRIQGVNPDLPAIEPPLWAGLIVSYHNVDILDAEAADLTLEQTVKAIRNSGHEDIIIVVMGNNPSVSSTPKMPIAEALADRISDLNVSFTGLHPIAVGSKYPVIAKPFEGFPMMPWHKLPMHLYRAHNWHCLDGSPRSPYASIYTSLGCPFNCYYCNIHALYGGKREVQFRPILDIFKEVETLVGTYQVRNIKIWDELFALKEDRVIEICEGLSDYDLNIWAYARLDTITEKMLKSMSRCGGIKWLAYGFESVADPKFVKRTEEVIEMTRDAGISIIANFMFGAPGTTQDDDKRSVEFAMKHLFEFVNFYDAKPYPGSQWYEDISKRPIQFPNVNPADYWANFSQYGTINDLRQKTFHDYFTNPDYLTMLRNKWGEQAVNQIRSMTEWQSAAPQAVR